MPDEFYGWVGIGMMTWLFSWGLNRVYLMFKSFFH